MRNIIHCFSVFIYFFILIGCASTEHPKDTAATVEDSIHVKAIYIGLIDSHSIEVIIDQTPTAIQLSEEHYKTLESLPTNTPITITYSVQKSTSQNILEHVEINE
ncbi:hypothetical protein [Metabacillus schmidteae]|uniref:hypothetical protein n=1 Tax=Metabacillus schmidteae TaxID=2730405 RepID=UPI00158E6EB7|nr:hypothetical protein [Metabacillus schmidteae]